MRTPSSDRGASAVETAFVLPVLLLVVFGMIELGGSLNSYSSAAGAVRSAGRSASLAGADPLADALILAEVDRGAAGGGAVVELVVIWHATGPGDTVPPACIPTATLVPNTASIGVSDGGTDAPGACNAYVLPGAVGGAFEAVAGTAPYPVDHYFGCQGASDPNAALMLDCGWPAMNRRVLTSPRTSAPKPSDFVGVYLRVRHPYYTQLFGSALTITDSSVSLIEPQGYEYS